MIYVVASASLTFAVLVLVDSLRLRAPAPGLDAAARALTQDSPSSSSCSVWSVLISDANTRAPRTRLRVLAATKHVHRRGGAAKKAPAWPRRRRVPRPRPARHR